MQAIMNLLEKYVVPVAAKIGSIPWLVALRDSFIATLPITMAGSLATLLNALLSTYCTVGLDKFRQCRAADHHDRQHRIRWVFDHLRRLLLRNVGLSPR